MEDKDTIVHADGCSTNLGIIGAICNCGSQTQAEISFKAGQEEEYKKWVKACMEAGMLISKPEQLVNLHKAGMKIVVDWGKGVCTDFSHSSPYIRGRLRRNCDKCWEAQLKEWGIDSANTPG